jgi:ubiquinone/menaquinone biosynthesis C-methylase UbiE
MLQTASMDCVLASLVLHYIQDWGPLLGELQRVLTPGGALVSRCSVRPSHPRVVASEALIKQISASPWAD